MADASCINPIQSNSINNTSKMSNNSRRNKLFSRISYYAVILMSYLGGKLRLSYKLVINKT